MLYAFPNESDGLGPNSLMLASNGVLYGTTVQGGVSDFRCSATCGTVFSVTLAGAKTTLHQLNGGTDGLWPEYAQGTLVELNGRLYGTALEGGDGPCGPNQDIGCGTIFSVAE